jgi:hypothetical protein
MELLHEPGGLLLLRVEVTDRDSQLRTAFKDADASDLQRQVRPKT